MCYNNPRFIRVLRFFNELLDIRRIASFHAYNKRFCDVIDNLVGDASFTHLVAAVILSSKS